MRYRVSMVTVSSDLPGVTQQVLYEQLQFVPGDWYNGDAVARTISDIEEHVHDHGFATVAVKPHLHTHPKFHAVDIDFEVDEASAPRRGSDGALGNATLRDSQREG